MTGPTSPEAVVLLHGLCRTRRSMIPMERALAAEGFGTWNVGYPSRTRSIADLADQVIPEALARCRGSGARTIHFVTHSMGGILVRAWAAKEKIPDLGRVVMLGPPNQGSEVVDVLGRHWIFGKLNGPAGRELGTGVDSTPNRLGPVTFPLGIIAGDRSVNWINSIWIQGDDDGKVSVERTRVAGMADHVVVHAPHPSLMRDAGAIRQTIRFLRTGTFEAAPADH
jgi:triacylglycerol lipase